MKTLLAVLLMLLVVSVPAAAQDETPCDIDLIDAITAMIEAQRAADMGDTFAAMQMLETVQKQIEAQLAACEGIGVTLGRTFTSADGLFRFNYPADWAFASPTNGVYVTATSQQLLSAFLDSNVDEALTSSEQFIGVVVIDLDEDDDLGDSFEAVIDEIEGEGLSPEMGLRRQSDAITVGKYEAVALNIISPDAEGKVYAINVAEENAVIAVVGFAARGEFAPLEPIFEAVAQSIQYGEATAQVPAGPSLEELNYTTAVKIDDLIPDINFRNAVLSPDGTKIAWHDPRDDGSMCLYTLADRQTSCQPVPEVFGSQPPLLLWSPDSRYVAFTQNFFIFFHEPDIWFFDTETETVTNMTDDGITRWSPISGLGEGDSEGPLWIDHTMTWGPDGSLYFLRLALSDPTSLDSGTTVLYRLDPESGESEMIRDLPAAVERLAVYGGRDLNLDSAMSVSPDGSMIAFVAMHPDREAAGNGVWIMPLDTREEATQLVHLMDFNAGMVIEDQEDGLYLFPTGIAWSADMQSLYVLAMNPQFQFTPYILYRIDVATGDMIPLTDFSGYTRQEILKVDEDGMSAVFDVPRAAVMSPDGTTPIIFHALPQNNRATISAISLVDGVPQRTLLYEVGDYQVVPTTFATASRDGKLLMWGYLFLPEED